MQNICFSGQWIPEDKFDDFVKLQSNIIDRYKPDILCLQEYAWRLMSKAYTHNNILGKRYCFIETAYENTSYDGNIITSAIVMPLVLAWYIVTELGSILENAVKMGASVPDWLVKLLKISVQAIDKVGKTIEKDADGGVSTAEEHNTDN